MSHTKGPWKVSPGTSQGNVYGSVVAVNCPETCGCKRGDLEAYGGHLVAESIAPRDRGPISALPELIALAKSIVAAGDTDSPFHLPAMTALFKAGVK